jgi:hypothetical protein
MSVMSLFWSTNGCSKQTIEVLQKCGLSLSPKSISSLQENLANIKVADSARIAQGPHKCRYNNINISTSIFVEQQSSAPAKVQSGTFAVIYELRNASIEAMRLGPILEQARTAEGLSFNADICPTLDQLSLFHHNTLINFIEILAEYVPDFLAYQKHPELQHKVHRPMPKDFMTKQYPLRVSTNDESSIAGQPKVLDNIYIEQLELKHEELEHWAIPSFHDQHTLSCT